MLYIIKRLHSALQGKAASSRPGKAMLTAKGSLDVLFFAFFLAALAFGLLLIQVVVEFRAFGIGWGITYLITWAVGFGTICAFLWRNRHMLGSAIKSTRQRAVEEKERNNLEN